MSGIAERFRAAQNIVSFHFATRRGIILRRFQYFHRFIAIAVHPHSCLAATTARIPPREMSRGGGLSAFRDGKDKEREARARISNRPRTQNAATFAKRGTACDSTRGFSRRIRRSTASVWRPCRAVLIRAASRWTSVGPPRRRMALAGAILTFASRKLGKS